MIATESSLPLSGPGSFSWFESVFNYRNELSRVLSALSSGFNPQTVINWFQQEITTFLTEHAVGQTALTIQPPSRYSIEINKAGAIVKELRLTEFGDLAESFLAYDQNTIPEITLGLERAFYLLSQLEPGQGVAIFSPSANYKKYGSTSDVINIFTVEAHQDNKTIVTSHFLFLNQELTPDERHYWLIIHRPDATLSSSLPQEIVSHPQLFAAKPNGSPLSPTEYIDWLNLKFIDRFGKLLFAKPQDEFMAKHIIQKVADKIHHLFDVLIHQGAHSLYMALWHLVEDGQKQWAVNHQLNPFTYWQDILAGVRPLSLGFHPTDGSDLSLYWDPITQDWIGGTRLCGGVEPIKHCRLHGDYTGDNCPKCKQSKFHD